MTPRIRIISCLILLTTLLVKVKGAPTLPLVHVHFRSAHGWLQTGRNRTKPTTAHRDHFTNLATL